MTNSRSFIFEKKVSKKEKHAQKTVMTRNLVKNKWKTTRRAIDAIVDIRQNECTD